MSPPLTSLHCYPFFALVYFVLNFNPPTPSYIILCNPRMRERWSESASVSFFFFFYAHRGYYMLHSTYRDSPDTINNRLHTPGATFSLLFLLPPLHSLYLPSVIYITYYEEFPPWENVCIAQTIEREFNKMYIKEMMWWILMTPVIFVDMVITRIRVYSTLQLMSIDNQLNWIVINVEYKREPSSPHECAVYCVIHPIHSVFNGAP